MWNATLTTTRYTSTIIVAITYVTMHVSSSTRLCCEYPHPTYVSWYNFNLSKGNQEMNLTFYTQPVYHLAVYMLIWQVLSCEIVLQAFASKLMISESHDFCGIFYYFMWLVAMVTITPICHLSIVLVTCTVQN